MSKKTIELAVTSASANPQYAITAQDAMTEIFRRSTTDKAFRIKLVTDPRAALSDFAGHQVPTSLNVRFIENQGTMTLVLPAAIDAAAELSDAELETVAGGALPLVPLAIASSLECAATVMAVGAAVLGWFD